MPAVTNVENIEIDYIRQLSNGKFFDDYTPENLPSRAYEDIRVSTDRLSFKLVDKNQRDLLSCVNGTLSSYNDKDYFEITGTYSKLEKRGYLTYLFEILIYDFNYNVLSDSEHSSPGSKEFWQAQIRRNKFSIYRLNIKSNHKRKASRFNENEIWGEPRKNSFNISSFFDEIENLGDEEFDDSDLIEIDMEVSTEILTADDFVYDDVKIATRRKYTSFEDIRLVAQKWKEE